MNRRGFTLSMLGAAVLGVSGTAAVMSRRRAAAPAERPAVKTATITRETLVDLVTAAGRIGYGPERLVESRLAGTVTGLAAVGALVDRGEVLFRIDDKPVVLLLGDLPAYRELTAGGPADPAAIPPVAAIPATKGADVRQFEENLKALGQTGFTVDDAYNEQTAAAVRRWQKKAGLPPTGVVELGRVIYAPAPVRVAKHRLAQGAVATGPVLAVTGAVRLVTAQVREQEQDLAAVRTKVTISLTSGRDVPGTVLQVATPAEPAAGAGQEPMVDVVVGFDDRQAVSGLDDGPVKVHFVAREVKDVLVVPVGALLALAEGGYGLELVEAGTTRVVAVTTGLFAGGKVEVSGPDLGPGRTVGMAR